MECSDWWLYARQMFWAVGASYAVTVAIFVMPTVGWRYLLAIIALPVIAMFLACFVSRRDEFLPARRRHASASAGSKWRISPDLRSGGTSYLRSTTSNNRSCTSQLRSVPFCWDPPLCWVESKHQTLFKCNKSQTECHECSKTPGRRSGTPPLLSAVRVLVSALQASHL